MENSVLAVKNLFTEKTSNMLRVIRPTSCFHKIFCLVCFVILCYFVIMDAFLYREIQKISPIITSNKSEKTTEVPMSSGLYYIFRGLSVKMIMLDHGPMYILTPLSNIFDEVTHFSTVFYFISPNMISVAHIVVAIISAKFVSSDSLLHRQLGILLFEFRNFLDAFDGVVHRNQKHVVTFNSEYGSIGHYMDSIADVLGYSALLLGCMVYLKRTLDRKQWAVKNTGLTEPNNNAAISLIAAYTLQIIIGAIGWGHFVKVYDHALQEPLPTIQQSMLQNALLKCNFTLIVMWCWRIISASAFAAMLCFAIFIDRQWEFLTFMQKKGIFLLIIAVLVTQLHYLDIVRTLSAVSQASELASRT